MRIVGAGLAGLIGAHAFPNAEIVEAADQPGEMHKALLRFRSDAVARLTGIEFTPVTVRKAIWMDGEFVEPSPRVANLYAQKVVGRIIDRSIWNLDAVTRWIAPETLYEQLVDAVGGRISWGHKFDFAANDEPVISTAPMSVPLDQLGIERQPMKHATITVKRFRIPGANVHQTVYFPTRNHAMYRASITGSLLIVEFSGKPNSGWEDDLAKALALPSTLQELGGIEQKYGKIAPIDDGERKAMVAALTERAGIYSLGRFATWRNILLDDVVQDIDVIKRLMRADRYHRKILAS